MATTDLRLLTTETEISAYLHRTRMSILEALRDGPSTASQVATRLGTHPANLTRHFRTLEGAGLIRLVEKRDTGRNLEKYYASTARRFRVAPPTSGLAAPHRIALTYARSELSSALVRLPDHPDGTVTTYVVKARIDPRKVSTFARQVAALAARLESADTDAGTPYQLVVALYPGADDPGDARDEIKLESEEAGTR